MDETDKGESVHGAAGSRGNPPEDLLERLRKLEEENKRLGEQNRSLGEQNKALEEDIDRLEKENEKFRNILRSKGIDPEFALEDLGDLVRKASMNSRNSSKPPSSDGYAKPAPKSRRVRSGKRPGGQKGHAGHTMTIPHDPDEIRIHYPGECMSCPHFAECEASSSFECSEVGHVVEAVVRTNVVEHRAMCVRHCPHGQCQGPLEAVLPEEVKPGVQYGNSFGVIVSILNTYGAVSMSRISTLIRDLFGVTLSSGTVCNMVKRAAGRVAPSLKSIKERVRASPVANFDETGARVDGKLLWIHNSSTPDFTYQTVNPKRGSAGIDANGVLPGFGGIAVHDCWGPYFKYDVPAHGLCCAHLLRELASVRESEPTHTWAGSFADLLMSMKKAKDSAMETGSDSLDRNMLLGFSSEYGRIMDVADRECPPLPEPKVRRRGRRKKGRERSLIERLRDNEDSICLFVRDFRVPFENNQAERDVRNVKTKVKVSGCFRSEEGASNYVELMSYLSTCRKHGIGVYEAYLSAFRGDPIMFQSTL